MFQWQESSNDDRRRLEAISSILHNNSNLLGFMFSKREARLNGSSEQILRAAGEFSTSEQVLIQVALDIWDGSGETKLMDIYQRLDWPHTVNILKTLAKFM